MNADAASAAEVREWAAAKDSRLAGGTGRLPRYVILAWDKAHPDRPFKPHAHGSLSTYTKGCRCEECKQAGSNYFRNYNAAGGTGRWDR